MFIVYNRSRGRVSLDSLGKIIHPGRFVVLDNLEYSDVVHDVKDHLDSGTVSVIYVPRDNDVIDPIEIVKDPLFQRSVKSRAFRRPPPPETLRYRDRFLLFEPLYGAWAGHDREIAEWRDGRWYFTRPQEGMIVWVEDEEKPYRFEAGSWEPADITSDATDDSALAVVEVTTQQEIPLHRVVTNDGRLADASDPTHVRRALGVSLEEVTIVGKPVRVLISGALELSYDLDPGINLGPVFLWFQGTIRDVSPSPLDGAVFSLVVGRAVSRNKIFVDLEPGVLF